MKIIALATIGFLALLTLGALPSGALMRWAGVLSFIAMFADLAFFITGVRDFRDNTFNTLVRVLAVLVPGVAFASYILVYMTGILIG